MKSSIKIRLIVALSAIAVLGAFASLSLIFAAPSTPSHQDETIQALNEALSETTNPAMRESLTEKLRIAQETRDEEIAAKSSAPNPSAMAEGLHYLETQTAKLAAEPKTHAPQHAAGAGFIVDESASPFPTSVFKVENNWYMDRGDGTIIVAYAGVLGYADPNAGLGALILRTEGDGSGRVIPSSSGTNRYPTSEAHGAIKIRSVAGMVLELVAADGTPMKFDVETRTWM